MMRMIDRFFGDAPGDTRLARVVSGLALFLLGIGSLSAMLVDQWKFAPNIESGELRSPLAKLILAVTCTPSVLVALALVPRNLRKRMVRKSNKQTQSIAGKPG